MIKRNQLIAFIFGLTIIIAGLPNFAMAQKKAKGKVVDSKGVGIDGATITANGVSVNSSSDGSFQIAVAKGKTLEVSKSGYEKATATFNGTTINVTLNPSKTTTAGANESNGPDSLPVEKIKPSLRYDGVVTQTFSNTQRRPLAYEDLRSDDVVFRVRLWEEIDCRQKINLPFMYKANQDSSNQRFISILFNSLNNPDTTKRVKVFGASLDDQFQIELTRKEIAEQMLGAKKKIEITDTTFGSPTYGQWLRDSFAFNPIDLDSSFQKFRIKEEVIFDRESSRLHWRIIGIAPVKREKIDGQWTEIETFWFYFPDLRPILATYTVFNGKNYQGQKSWDDYFQERMFSSYIYKTSQNNFFNRRLQDIPGMKGEVNLLRLYESDNIKNKIFDMEQNAWSY